MNRFMSAAYDLATHVARNELGGVGRDAFEVVDQAAFTLASEVRQLEDENYHLRMELNCAREDTNTCRKQHQDALERLTNATEDKERYRDTLWGVLGGLMSLDLLTPGMLYQVIPSAIIDAATEAHAGKKINAIKIIRAATCVGLVDCKTWVEAWLMPNV